MPGRVIARVTNGTDTQLLTQWRNASSRLATWEADADCPEALRDRFTKSTAQLRVTFTEDRPPSPVRRDPPQTPQEWEALATETAQYIARLPQPAEADQQDDAKRRRTGTAEKRRERARGENEDDEGSIRSETSERNAAAGEDEFGQESQRSAVEPKDADAETEEAKLKKKRGRPSKEPSLKKKEKESLLSKRKRIEDSVTGLGLAREPFGSKRERGFFTSLQSPPIGSFGGDSGARYDAMLSPDNISSVSGREGSLSLESERGGMSSPHGLHNEHDAMSEMHSVGLQMQSSVLPRSDSARAFGRDTLLQEGGMIDMTMHSGMQEKELNDGDGSSGNGSDNNSEDDNEDPGDANDDDFSLQKKGYVKSDRKRGRPRKVVDTQQPPFLAFDQQASEFYGRALTLEEARRAAAVSQQQALRFQPYSDPTKMEPLSVAPTPPPTTPDRVPGQRKKYYRSLKEIAAEPDPHQRSLWMQERERILNSRKEQRNLRKSMLMNPQRPGNPFARDPHGSDAGEGQHFYVNGVPLSLQATPAFVSALIECCMNKDVPPPVLPHPEDVEMTQSMLIVAHRQAQQQLAQHSQCMKTAFYQRLQKGWEAVTREHTAEDEREKEAKALLQRCIEGQKMFSVQQNEVLDAVNARLTELFRSVREKDEQK